MWQHSSEVAVAFAKYGTAADNQMRQRGTGENDVQFNSHPYVYIIMVNIEKLPVLFGFNSFVYAAGQ